MSCVVSKPPAQYLLNILIQAAGQKPLFVGARDKPVNIMGSQRTARIV
jgi:ribonucleotide reductase beta subunit family protein with ferritin-like domain